MIVLQILILFIKQHDIVDNIVVLKSPNERLKFPNIFWIPFSHFVNVKLMDATIHLIYQFLGR